MGACLDKFLTAPTEAILRNQSLTNEEVFKRQEKAAEYARFLTELEKIAKDKNKRRSIFKQFGVKLPNPYQTKLLMNAADEERALICMEACKRRRKKYARNNYRIRLKSTFRHMFSLDVL